MRDKNYLYKMAEHRFSEVDNVKFNSRKQKAFVEKSCESAR